MKLINVIKKRLKRSMSTVIYSKEIKDTYSTGSICGNGVAGKRVLVIGGSSGIGKATAERYLREGAAAITIVGRNAGKLSDLKKEFPDNRLYTHCWDISNTQDMDKHIETIAALMEEIDIVVLCAGVFSKKEQKREYLDFTEQEFEYTMNINLKGNFFLCQNMARYWIANKRRGTIVIVSSICAVSERFQFTPYGLSKNELSALVRGAAAAFSDYGIIVNGIAPGSVATQMSAVEEGDSLEKSNNLIHRMIVPEEISALIVFMSSHYGEMLSGTVVEASAQEKL